MSLWKSLYEKYFTTNFLLLLRLLLFLPQSFQAQTVWLVLALPSLWSTFWLWSTSFPYFSTLFWKIICRVNQKECTKCMLFFTIVTNNSDLPCKQYVSRSSDFGFSMLGCYKLHYGCIFCTGLCTLVFPMFHCYLLYYRRQICIAISINSS